MKIQRAAAKAGLPPKEFCDSGAEIFKSLAHRIGLSNDHFVRTTDEEHQDAVRYFWHLLRDRGYIYESKHEGWYCVSDETFYPDSSIEKRLDPATGRTIMASKETGKEVEWTSEANYHFKLSEFRDKLLDFYEKNPNFVVPHGRMQDVVRWVSAGLEDLSISRPVGRLSWGIRVPDDNTQTIYVWLDALVNYITKAGYPWTPGQEHSLGWPADVQVIGKDIVRFHCIYWPAFLMALDIEPPKQILTHAHWTLGRQKMAKSTGNVVNPFFALDRFGVDAMRYYLVCEGGIGDDADYGNHHIVEKYKKGLSGGLGNLVSRVARSKLWNVRNAVMAYTGDDYMELSKLETDVETTELVTQLKEIGEKTDAKMRDLAPNIALQQIMAIVFEVRPILYVFTIKLTKYVQTNRYFDTGSPWRFARNKKPAAQQQVLRTIYHCAEAIRIIGILLQPFMPAKATQLLDMLGVEHTNRTFSDAQIGLDSSYGVGMVPLGTGVYDSLFPPLLVEK